MFSIAICRARSRKAKPEQIDRVARDRTLGMAGRPVDALAQLGRLRGDEQLLDRAWSALTSERLDRTELILLDDTELWIAEEAQARHAGGHGVQSSSTRTMLWLAPLTSAVTSWTG